MKIIRILALALFASSFTLHAAEKSAATNYYGLSFMEVSSSAGTTNYAPTGILLRLGHRFSYDFALEFHTGSASSGSSLAIDRINSFLMRWEMPYERFHLHTMVGLSRVVFDDTNGKVVNDGGSYGVGARFETNGPYDIQLEWMSYIGLDAYNTDSINIGFIRYF
ncbi:MAG: hypothetical protein HUJ30_08500 [Gammaproteobacteria bacterium]|nr:hypothetical protein [Gammaproteobacteria bacterium]